MSPFDPIGEKARWRIIYDLLMPLAVDDILTYDDMSEALELDAVNDRHAIQMAVRRAAKEFEQEDNRALEAVPNKGYRIVEPQEHMRLAQQHQRKSHKALAAGRSKVVHVDLSGLDPEARKAFEIMAKAFSMQMDFNRRMDVRQKRLEATVTEIVGRSDRSEQEIAKLRERLERLERPDDSG